MVTNDKTAARPGASTRYRRSAKTRAPRKRTFIAAMEKYLIARRLSSGTVSSPCPGNGRHPLLNFLPRQRWSVDILSMVSLALFLGAVALLPGALAGPLLALEAVFAFGISPLRYSFFNGRDTSAPGTLGQALRLLTKLLDPSEGHLRTLTNGPRGLLGWFLGVGSAKELGHLNITELLLYTLFGKKPPLSEVGSAEDLGLHFISSLGLDVEPGHNPKASYIAHTEEPLQASYRPLFFYLVTELVASYGHFKLTKHNFVEVASNDTATYYMKNAPATTNRPSSAQPETPLVFLHGIGVGLAPYIGFLDRMSERTGRPIIAVTYKHVSMRLTGNIPSAVQVADDVAAFLQQRGIAKATMVAHSYGTLVASSFTKRHGSLLAGLTLIDPVCFAMFLPHLIRNTLYFHMDRPPRSETFTWKSLMKGLVVRDLHCSAAMSRGFNWQDVNLWASELPANTTVALAGDDNMIPVQAVKDLMSSPAAVARGAQLVFHPTRGHGGFLLDADMQARIIAGQGISGPPAAAEKLPGAPFLAMGTAEQATGAAKQVLSAAAAAATPSAPAAAAIQLIEQLPELLADESIPQKMAVALAPLATAVPVAAEELHGMPAAGAQPARFPALVMAKESYVCLRSRLRTGQATPPKEHPLAGRRVLGALISGPGRAQLACLAEAAPAGMFCHQLSSGRPEVPAQRSAGRLLGMVCTRANWALTRGMLLKAW